MIFDGQRSKPSRGCKELGQAGLRASSHVTQARRLAAGCHHNGCSGENWHSLKSRFAGDGQITIGSDAGDEEWLGLVPFDQYAVPPFPLDTLPPWVRKFVEALAVETQTPADLPALLTLALLAAASAKKVRIHIRPGWSEPANLYTVVALPPGHRKTTVASRLVGPVLALKRELLQELEPEMRRLTLEREVAEARLRKAKSDATRADDEETRNEHLKAANQIVEEMSRVVGG